MVHAIQHIAADVTDTLGLMLGAFVRLTNMQDRGDSGAGSPVHRRTAGDEA
ncbi:MAG: hypothetical protein ACJAVR_002522 [Paracoccaceae bacterium]